MNIESSSHILDAIASAVIAVDEKNCIRYANVSGCKLFNTPFKSIENKEISHLTGNCSEIISAIEYARSNKSSYRIHGVEIKSPHIELDNITVTANNIQDIENWIAVSFDENTIAAHITNRIKHEYSSKYVGAMSAMLAHEVKNPLSGIKGAAQLLKHNAYEKDCQLVDLICEETDRIASLVTGMEAFSDESPVELKPENIHEIIGYSKKIAEHGFAKNIGFTESYDPSLPSVLANKDMMIQVIINLLKNASEAMETKNGAIHISTGYVLSARVVSKDNEIKNLPVMISIKDNGKGIPDNIKESMFAPFITSKPAGKGLGLPMVERIIDRHSGIIEFSSDKNGTEFRVFLPKAK